MGLMKGKSGTSVGISLDRDGISGLTMPVLALTLLVQCRCFRSIPTLGFLVIKIIKLEGISQNGWLASPAGVGLPKHSHLPNPLHNSPRLGK
jgi:hypothetical protein